MSAELKEQLDKHEEDIKQLMSTQAVHSETITTHSDHIARLNAAMDGLRLSIGSVQGTMATHDDVLMLNNKIHESFNGLLKDALAAVPQKFLVSFAGIAAFIAFLALIADIFFHFHG